MKKCLLIALFFSFIFAFASCNERELPYEDSTEQSEITCGSSDTTGVCTGCTTSATETQVTTETGAYVETLSVFAAYISDTYGELISPYTSQVYLTSGSLNMDGVLMFQSLENVLPGWVENGLIPDIRIDDTSHIRISCAPVDNIETIIGSFRILIYENDGYQEVERLENSTIADVAAYVETLATDERVYIAFPVTLKIDDENAHQIMCVFSTFAIMP